MMLNDGGCSYWVERLATPGEPLANWYVYLTVSKKSLIYDSVELRYGKALTCHHND